MKQFISEAEANFILDFIKVVTPALKSNSYDPLDTILQDEFPGWTNSGCTKRVFILDDLDWVIKIDLNPKKPYCQREVENYEAAVKAGLAEYFANTFYFIEWDGIAFYIQERLDAENEMGDNYSVEIAEILASSISDDGFEGTEDEYEEEVMSQVNNLEDCEVVEILFHNERLNSFIYEHDINDLHFGNFGKREENFVIFDFSGFDIL